MGMERLAAYLAVDKDGTRLRMNNENGESRAALGVTKDMVGLALNDKNGKSRIVLGVAKEGPMLGLNDADGKTRAVLGITQTTTPDGKVITYPESSLLLFDPNGNVIWEAPR